MLQRKTAIIAFLLCCAGTSGMIRRTYQYLHASDARLETACSAMTTSGMAYTIACGLRFLAKVPKYQPVQPWQSRRKR